MSDEKKALPAPEEEFDEELFEQLSPKQQKYIEMSVGTNLSKSDLAKHLKVSKALLTRWDKLPAVSSLMNSVQKRLMQDSVTQMRVQNKTLRDKMYAETMSRFDSPADDPILNDPDTPISIRKMRASRYSEYASFDSMLKGIKIMNDLSQVEEEVAGSQDADFVKQVRRRHLKLRRQRQGFAEIASSAGLEVSDYTKLVTSNGVDFTAEEGRQKPDEYEETVEVIEEEISITRRKKND